MYNWFEQYD
jgi:hypothetical protein